MKISELIAALETVKNAHGDLRVTHHFGTSVRDVDVVIDSIRVNSGRQSLVQYWSKYTDSPEQRGETVVRL